MIFTVKINASISFSGGNKPSSFSNSGLIITVEYHRAIKYILEIYHKSNQRENNQKRQKEIDKTVDQSLVT